MAVQKIWDQWSLQIWMLTVASKLEDSNLNFFARHISSWSCIIIQSFLCKSSSSSGKKKKKKPWTKPGHMDGVGGWGWRVLMHTTTTNKYISLALNPSLSNLGEAQSTIHVPLKLKEPKKPGMGWWRGKVQVLNTPLIIHYITLSLILSLPPTLSLSLSPSLLPSLPLPRSPFHSQINNTDNSMIKNKQTKSSKGSRLLREGRSG